MSTQIRLPEDLHERLTGLAQRQYRSLNSLMVYLLAEGAEREMQRAGENGREAAGGKPDS